MRSIRAYPRVELPDEVRQKAVAMGVARSQIKRFKHEDYMRMYNGGVFTNVVNFRIGFKIQQLRLTVVI